VFTKSGGEKVDEKKKQELCQENKAQSVQNPPSIGVRTVRYWLRISEGGTPGKEIGRKEPGGDYGLRGVRNGTGMQGGREEYDTGLFYRG